MRKSFKINSNQWNSIKTLQMFNKNTQNHININHNQCKSIKINLNHTYMHETLSPILFMLFVLLVLLVFLVLPVRFPILPKSSKIHQNNVKIIQNQLTSMKCIFWFFQNFKTAHKITYKTIKINANLSKSIQITRTCMTISSASVKARAIHCYIYSVCSLHMFDHVIFILGH